jgi:transposase
MANHAKVLSVSEVDAAVLKKRVRAKSSPAKVVERARIVLLASEGLPAEAIAQRVGCSRPTVVAWRKRYAEAGLAGLDDAPRSGAPRTLTHAQADILYATLDGPPEELGVTHWSSRLLAKQLGVSHMTVARVWRMYGLQPWREGTFKFSTDPELEAKVRGHRRAVPAPAKACGGAVRR